MFVLDSLLLSLYLFRAVEDHHVYRQSFEDDSIICRKSLGCNRVAYGKVPTLPAVRVMRELIVYHSQIQVLQQR